jgi:hypothetical protein
MSNPIPDTDQHSVAAMAIAREWADFATIAGDDPEETLGMRLRRFIDAYEVIATVTRTAGNAHENAREARAVLAELKTSP